MRLIRSDILEWSIPVVNELTGINFTYTDFQVLFVRMATYSNEKYYYKVGEEIVCSG